MTKTPREWVATLPKYGTCDTAGFWCSVAVYESLCRSAGVEPEARPDGAVACWIFTGQPIEWHDEKGDVIR